MSLPQTPNARSERRDESPPREDTLVREKIQQLPWDAQDNEYLWQCASGRGQPNYARINESLPIAPNRRTPGALRLQYFKLRGSLKKALKDASSQKFAPESIEECAQSLWEWMQPVFRIAVAHRPSIAQIDELDPLALFVEFGNDDVADHDERDIDDVMYGDDGDANDVMDVDDGDADNMMDGDDGDADDVVDRDEGNANVQGNLPLARPIPEILQREFAKYVPVNKEHPWVRYGLPPLIRALQ